MKKKVIILIFILIIAFTVTACDVNTTVDKETSNLTDQLATPSSDDSDQGEKLKIHFIDVGQADCTLIELPNGEEALIDTGNTEDAETIINYIENLNIDDIEYLILTHPHEDHIGSAKEIIEKIDIEKVYIPDVTVDTKLYENTMSAIESYNITVMKAKAGLKIIDTPELKFEVLAPKSMYYSEMNEYSIVTKLNYQDTSFLFTGDAESVSELEMIRSGYDLNCDLLKVGHHGGRTSSSWNFLQSVTPEYSVIFSEKGNSYGHPHKETLDRLSSIGSKIYRTDEAGTIIASSDGKNISINKNNNSTTDNASTEQSQYFGNKNSFVFHAPNCSSVDEMKKSNKVIFNQRQEAIDKGYKPCSKCNP